MFSLKMWTTEIDLTDFYCEAAIRGYINNDNKKMLIDSLASTDNFSLWILYYNDSIVGTSASHLLEIAKNSYRICARTAVLTSKIPVRNFNKNTILKHQNVTTQIFIKNFIDQLPTNADLIITTNNSTEASQLQVHRTYCPMLERLNVLTDKGTFNYRGHNQTFWNLDRQTLLNQIDYYNKNLGTSDIWKYQIV